MKKKMFFVVLTAVVLTLSGCGVKEPRLSESLNPMVITPSTTDANPVYPKGVSLNQRELEDATILFKDICNFFQQEKEMLKIIKVSRAEMTNFFTDDMHACYVSNNQTIYLLESFDFQKDVDRKIFVHEVLHYLSDNGENTRGLLKVVSGKELNRLLNEGTTEWLTWKFAGNNASNTPYLFQVLLASELEILFGEEALIAAYFNSDDSVLKKAFNKAVSPYYGDSNSRAYSITLDAFDSFACSMMSLDYLENLGMMEKAGELLAALQEEILFAARSCGKTQEIQERFRSFWEVDMEITDMAFLNEFVQYDYLKKIK